MPDIFIVLFFLNFLFKINNMDASLSSSFHKLNENIVEFNRLGYLTLPHKYKSLINKTL